MFEKIEGQEMAKKQLSSILESKKISNAYIFSGPEGVGKKLMAEEFSSILLDTNLENSQDFNFIEAKSNESSIKIEKIRNLIEKMGIKPYKDYKIFLINDAEKMTIPAQNSLLKTLEEPPYYGIIILVTKNKESLLETIRSRCIEIKFSPLSKDEIARIISRQNYDKDLVQMAINLSKSYGSISMISKLCNDVDIIGIRDRVEGFLKKLIIDKSKIESIYTPEYFNVYKDDIKILLDILKSYIRDCILVKELASERLLINEDRYLFMVDISRNISLNKLGSILDEVEIAERKFNSNCNFNSTVESMAVNIYKIVNK